MHTSTGGFDRHRFRAELDIDHWRHHVPHHVDNELKHDEHCPGNHRRQQHHVWDGE